MNAPTPSVNPILHLFNSHNFLQTKRGRGRPKKIQPALLEGHMKHILSDEDEDAVIELSTAVKLSIKAEYKHELNIVERKPFDIITELAKAHKLDYRTVYDLVN